MGGALPFTNMQNLRTENNEDGTYRYEDFTQDGQILVVNTVEPTRLVPEVQDLEDYLIACAFALSDTDTYELLSAEENEEYTENLTYPVQRLFPQISRISQIYFVFLHSKTLR